MFKQDKKASFFQGLLSAILIATDIKVLVGIGIFFGFLAIIFAIPDNKK